MVEIPEQPVADSDRRRFDRNLLKTGGRRAHLVVEAVPFTWFCDRTEGTRSKDHIFAQWLLRHPTGGSSNEAPSRSAFLCGQAP